MITGVDLSVRQFTEAWRLMAESCPGRSLASGDGLECVFTGLPVSFFNTVFVTLPGVSADALRECARRASEWAAPRGVPWLFVVTAETLEPGVDAPALLEGCGLAPIMQLTGMQADRLAPAGPGPEGLQLTVPEDDEACMALLDVNSAAYGMDLGAAREPFGRRAFWQSQFPVVGRVGTNPVSCAAVMMVEGCRYVALVATEPAHQRRGFAEASMRRALDLAARAHGESQTVLHASEAGRPVYQRMGYTPISTHGIYMEARLLHGH